LAKIDTSKVPVKSGSIYPPPYAAMVAGRSSLRLGEVAGLTQFGVNLVTLQPGAMSSLRHWHLHEDEFVMVTEGECVMVVDEGETLMQVGDCAGFPAGSGNGHHFFNRTDRPARFLVIGSKAPVEVVTYSDIDLVLTAGAGKADFTLKDGTPFVPPVA
jgi:uncharacterized cupin superfamily protein